VTAERDGAVGVGRSLEPLQPRPLTSINRHGKRSGQWSIRINDQWRVCFRFEDGDAFDVEIVDYH
jgi:plasmid maintenance system killer protein